MAMHPKAKEVALMVKYEFDMFNACAIKLLNGPKTNDLDGNITLEGFLLHARILRDFFIGKEKIDDVVAAHFFDDLDEWNDKKPKSFNYLIENKERINKYLAHLTYERINMNKNWDVPMIFREIYDAWNVFYSLLPQDRKEWFTE